MTRATTENINGICSGAKVRLKQAYGTGTKYFLCYLHDGYCMISDSKRDYKNDMGFIHSIYNIEAFEPMNI